MSSPADQVRGLIRRLRLPYLKRYHDERVVQSAYALVNGGISIGLLSLLASLTGSPFVFPSLGPTAFLLFHKPLARASSPRNALLGHAIGVLLGWISLVLFGLEAAPPALETGVGWPRIGAAALSLGGTGGLMVLLGVAHPPAGATTLIVSLGLMRRPTELLVLMGGVAILIAQGWVINRLAGLDYPLWSARRTSQERQRRLDLQRNAEPGRTGGS